MPWPSPSSPASTASFPSTTTRTTRTSRSTPSTPPPGNSTASRSPRPGRAWSSSSSAEGQRRLDVGQGLLGGPLAFPDELVGPAEVEARRRADAGPDEHVDERQLGLDHLLLHRVHHAGHDLQQVGIAVFGELLTGDV